jgi:hypothetical protein
MALIIIMMIVSLSRALMLQLPPDATNSLPEPSFSHTGDLVCGGARIGNLYSHLHALPRFSTCPYS